MNSPNTRLLIFALAFVFIAGMIPIFAPRLMTGAVALPTLMVIVFVGLVLVLSAVNQSRQSAGGEKRKRDEEAVDPYERIDRMVDTLDADQLAYLRDRMEQHTGRSTARSASPMEKETSNASVNGAHQHHRKDSRA